jgi:hypothetical protein
VPRHVCSSPEAKLIDVPCTDLLDGFLGAGIGAFLLVVWALARYACRRLPSTLAREMLMTAPHAGRGPA